MALLTAEKRKAVRDKISKINLEYGSHSGEPGSYCVMELVSTVAKEKKNDNPKTSCPVLTELLININDSVEDTTRQLLLRLVPFLIGTAKLGDKGKRVEG